MWSMIFVLLLVIAAIIVWDKYFKDTFLGEHGIRPDHYVIPADSPMVSLELRRAGGSSTPIAKKIVTVAEKISAKTAEPTRPISVSGADDLTKIKGIGIVIAKQLSDNGITSYQQIASLTSEDLDRLNEKIHFRGNNNRETWPEQAADLMG